MKLKIAIAAALSTALFAPLSYSAGDYSSDSGHKGKVAENVSDAGITAKIKAEYAKDKEVSALKINIDTDKDGQVTLTGTVGSKAEADKAERIAKETHGVKHVTNNLKVK